MLSKKGRKHYGKRRNCSLRAIYPSPAVFPKDLYCRHVKTRAFWGERVNSNYNYDRILYSSKLKAFADSKFNVLEFVSERVENIVGKKKCWLPVFPTCPIIFFLTVIV